MAVIVTGKHNKVTVRIKVNGKPFQISETAIVKGALITADHKTRLTDVLPIYLNAPGTDLSRSTVILHIPPSQTLFLAYEKPIKIEIEVSDPDSRGYFADARLLKGLI